MTPDPAPAGEPPRGTNPYVRMDVLRKSQASTFLRGEGVFRSALTDSPGAWRAWEPGLASSCPSFLSALSPCWDAIGLLYLAPRVHRRLLRESSGPRDVPVRSPPQREFGLLWLQVDLNESSKRRR